MFDWPPEAYLTLVAAIASLSGALVALATSHGRSINRRLAAVFGLEFGFALNNLLNLPGVWGGLLGGLVIGSIFPAYVCLLAMLDVPWLRFFRSRAGVLVAVLYPLAFTGLGSFLLSRLPPGADSGDVLGPLIGINMLLGALVGLVASIVAFRRAPRGTQSRERARAFLFAFGTRDALWVAAPATALASAYVFHAVLPPVFWGYFIPIVSLVYLPILAYGVLRSQLFDIDLRIRWGIEKATVVSILVLAFFIGEKLAEQILNKAFGWILGSVLAGALVFLAPRLNKLGDKAAHAALPKVENTSEYIRFRKLEVYKAAVESALETGGVSDKERASLARLRAKLAISESDAAMLEADAAASASPAIAPDEPQTTGA